MKKKYIIFDFDGTLLNTNDVIVASWEATFENFLGYMPVRKKIEATFGETLKNTIKRCFPNESYEDVRDYYRKYQDEHCDGMVYVYDGIRELLEELREMGCKIGVATSRTTRSYWKYMEDFNLLHLVDEVVTMDDVKKHKPHPDTILKLLEKFGATPEESIMLGDTKYDIGCAMNAGVDSVLVGWSHYVDMEDMAADGFVPTYQLARPADLLPIIK
ncbi:MAG: HAD family hydrolase [Mogibacterium sp.]|nr:HAD family hydrolase [Mogibacterium sp.]